MQRGETRRVLRLAVWKRGKAMVGFSWGCRIGLLSVCMTLALGTCVTSAQESKPDGAPLTARAENATTTTPQDPPIDPRHPLYLPLQEAYKSRDALKAVKDYEAEFTKRELVGKKLHKTTMNLKLRAEPFSVYLKFIEPNAGREVIYVQGKNNNNLLVHETGFKAIAGTLSLSPTGPDAMADNKYPVTMIGMHNLLDKIIAQWEAEGKFGDIATQKYPDAKLPSKGSEPPVECIAYESTHSKPAKQFKYHTTRLWIDKKTSMPVRVEQLGFPHGASDKPPVVEEYTYANLKLNPKLVDRDFDKKNPAYAFP